MEKQMKTYRFCFDGVKFDIVGECLDARAYSLGIYDNDRIVQLFKTQNGLILLDHNHIKNKFSDWNNEGQDNLTKIEGITEITLFLQQRLKAAIRFKSNVQAVLSKALVFKQF
jgi:hypothetical protein